MNTIINAALFQLTWFACVLGGTAWGLIGVATLVLFSFVCGSWRQDLVYAAAAVLIGAALDTLWIQLGVLDFGTLLSPIWILLMWLGLGLTVNHSLSFLHNKPLLAALLAACSAPLCYFAGERFGAVIIASPVGVMLISAAWGILFYLTFRRSILSHAQS